MRIYRRKASTQSGYPNLTVKLLKNNLLRILIIKCRLFGFDSVEINIQHCKGKMLEILAKSLYLFSFDFTLPSCGDTMIYVL